MALPYSSVIKSRAKVALACLALVHSSATAALAQNGQGATPPVEASASEHTGPPDRPSAAEEVETTESPETREEDATSSQGSPTQGEATLDETSAPQPERSPRLSPRLKEAPQTRASKAPATTQRRNWLLAYEAARQRILDGDFSEANLEFLALAKTAPSPSLAQLAKELARLSLDLHDGRRALVLREELEQSDLGAKESGERSKDELALLYVNAAIYGIGSGAWMGVLTEGESTAAIVLPMFGFAGAGITTIALLDHNDAFKYGVPQSIVSGMYLGLFQGSLWTAYAGAVDNVSSKAAATAIWGSATAGAVLGGVLGSELGTTPGRASWVGTNALWTGAVSGLVATAADNDEDGLAPLLGAAIGHGVGIASGMLSARHVAPSIARVRYIDLGAIGGGLVTGGVYLMAASESFNGRAFAGITAGGIAAGLVTSTLLTQKMKKDLLPEERDGDFSMQTQFSPLPGGAQLGLSGTW